MKKNKKTSGAESNSKPESAPQPTLLAAGFAFDFGGSLGTGGRPGGNDTTGFDNTPRAPHDPFKMKPPSCPSLF